jgi:hypothetical protein
MVAKTVIEIMFKYGNLIFILYALFSSLSRINHTSYFLPGYGNISQLSLTIAKSMIEFSLSQEFPLLIKSPPSIFPLGAPSHSKA